MTQRASRRSPLGRYIAAALKGGKAHGRHVQAWRDTAFGERLAAAAHFTAHGQDYRPTHITTQRERRGRQLLAAALILAECRRGEYSSGPRVYRGTIAKRLRVSETTADRLLHSLRAAGLVKAHQPNVWLVPEHMRGRPKRDEAGELVRDPKTGRVQQWAYNVYRWTIELPRDLAIALKRWRQAPGRLEVAKPEPSRPPLEARPEVAGRFAALLPPGALDPP